MEFENDPAADFLNREKKMLGELENEIANSHHNADSGPTSDDFVIVDNNIQENNNDNENEDAFVGMQIQKPSQQKEEPEKIRLWKERQALMLEEKDKDEKEAIEKLKEAGKKELDDWYKNNQSNLEKTKANNRLDESNRNKKDVNDATEGQEIWKCVYNLCDFSQQKTSVPRDRMRNILLQLNQTPLTKN